MLALQSSKWGKKCSIFQIPKYSTFDLGKDLKILLERLKGILCWLPARTQGQLPPPQDRLLARGMQVPLPMSVVTELGSILEGAPGSPRDDNKHSH